MHLISEYKYICNGLGCRRKNVLPKTIIFVYLGKTLTEQTIKKKQTNKHRQASFTFFRLLVYSVNIFFLILISLSHVLCGFQSLHRYSLTVCWYCVSQPKPLITPMASLLQSNSEFFHLSSLWQGKPPHFHLLQTQTPSIQGCYVKEIMENYHTRAAEYTTHIHTHIFF